MTVTIELLNDATNLYPLAKFELTVGKTYSQFYQIRLRELITNNRFRKERETRVARESLIKAQAIENRLNQQRLHKEYMQYIRERAKFQLQESVVNNAQIKIGTKRQFFKANPAVTLTVTTNSIATSIEPRSKQVAKTKLPPIEDTKSSQPPLIKSAPTSSEKKVRPKGKLPSIVKVDRTDEPVGGLTDRTFTQAVSSSHNHHTIRKYTNARQSILDSIMAHFDTYKPSKIQNDSTYEDFKNKFSSSFAPSVYQNYERTVD